MGAIAREEVTDEVLMMRFQAGDRAAFTNLVRKHKTPIYNFILRLVRSSSAAEQLVQDVFVMVGKSASYFKHESRFSTWAYAIARNICIDHLRKMSFRQHASLDQAHGDSPDGPTLLDRTADAHHSASVERSVIGVELGRRITRCVEELPQEQREVFLLREVANLPFKDIASIPGGTA